MDSDTRERLMKSITRAIAGLCVASVECFAFALLDTWTGVLRGTTLLVGQWWAIAITFGLIGWGAWWASGVIVNSIEAGSLPFRWPSPRAAAFASEAEKFTVVDSLPKAAPAGRARSERVRRIERMVQP